MKQTKEELKALLAEHGTYTAVGNFLGISRDVVARKAHELGLESPQRRGGKRHCDICGTDSSKRLILRFQLTVSGKKAGVARGAKRSVGTIFLCEPCWKSGPRKWMGIRGSKAKLREGGVSISS